MANAGLPLDVEGRTVTITNPDKVFFPARGETKLDLVRYYLRVGEALMHQMRGRPVLLQRFPDGATGSSFFQKRVPAGAPEWLQTTTVTTPNGTRSNALVAADLAHLVWAVNLGCLGFHVWPYLADDPDHIDELRLDLDPQPGTGFAEARAAAFRLRELLGELGLRGYPKTTGSRGVHVYLRLVPRWDAIAVRAAAVAVARELERRHPDTVTASWWKEERGARVFLDYNQNAPHKTVFGAWSVRARVGAQVSTPLTWDALADVDADELTIATVPTLLDALGDPWADIDAPAQSLEPLLELAEADRRRGLLDAPWPPVYPKMPGEPPRVAPSRSRRSPGPAGGDRRATGTTTRGEDVMSEARNAPGGRPRTTTRDHAELRMRLQRWLESALPAGAQPEIVSFQAPTTNGMSSETVLFDLEVTEDGRRSVHRLVGRIAPDPAAVPVFPHYDLAGQARTMQLVAEHSEVPVPKVRFVEPSADPLGAPFFVMDRVDGDVPPDVMPYTFDSWVTAASDAERAVLERDTVAVLAGIHAISDVSERFAHLDLTGGDGRTPLRAHVDEQRRYLDWVMEGQPAPLLEAAFDWLEANWPDEGPAVLSWGDSRIGNVLYREFRPVAVLDWEMAAPGPRELDLGWLVFMHRFFQDLTEQYGMPGLPGLLRPASVTATYRELTGHEPADLRWFVTYAALRHGIIMTRIARRAIHFGEAEPPASPDDLFMHRGSLEAMLDGSYWARLDG